MHELFYEIKRSAKLASTVLLVGESGVGKDHIAYQIHKLSPRNKKPFLCVPIHTLSSTLIESELFGYEKGAFSGAVNSKVGRFEATDGGTLYLPEISELPESIQLKLLYFLQYRSITRIGQNPFTPEKDIDVRLIFATNENLDQLVDEGKIRLDFYHRINIVTLEIPPLRERREDITPLIKYFVNRYSNQFFNREIKIAPNVYEYFYDYDWPGNVRELENTIERLLIKSGEKFANENNDEILTVEDIQNCNCFSKNSSKKSVPKGSLIYDPEHNLFDYKVAQLNFKKKYFSTLLNQTNGNIFLASKIAKLTPQGLRKILKQINFFD